MVLISSLSPVRRILRCVRESRTCLRGVNCTTLPAVASQASDQRCEDRCSGVERRRLTRPLGILAVDPVLPLSNEVRCNAGVKPVDGPGSEKRNFFRAFRGVAIVVLATINGPLGSEPVCFATWLLVRDAGKPASTSTLLLETELLRRFRVSRRFMLAILAYRHAASSRPT